MQLKPDQTKKLSYDNVELEEDYTPPTVKRTLTVGNIKQEIANIDKQIESLLTEKKEKEAKLKEAEKVAKTAELETIQ